MNICTYLYTLLYVYMYVCMYMLFFLCYIIFKEEKSLTVVVPDLVL